MVCPSVNMFSAPTRNGTTKVMPKSSALHWLDFKLGEFCKSTAFQTYGVNTN